MKSAPPLKPKKLTFTLSQQSYSLLENLSNYLNKSPKEVAKEALEAYLAYLVEKKKHHASH